MIVIFVAAREVQGLGSEKSDWQDDRVWHGLTVPFCPLGPYFD